jgi:hypothetical protein
LLTGKCLTPENPYSYRSAERHPQGDEAMIMFVLGMSLGACIGVIAMGICKLGGESTPSSVS